MKIIQMNKLIIKHCELLTVFVSLAALRLDVRVGFFFWATTIEFSLVLVFFLVRRAAIVMTNNKVEMELNNVNITY